MLRACHHPPARLRSVHSLAAPRRARRQRRHRVQLALHVRVYLSVARALVERVGTELRCRVRDSGRSPSACLRRRVLPPCSSATNAGVRCTLLPSPACRCGRIRVSPASQAPLVRQHGPALPFLQLDLSALCAAQARWPASLRSHASVLHFIPFLRQACRRQRPPPRPRSQSSSSSSTSRAVRAGRRPCLVKHGVAVLYVL